MLASVQVILNRLSGNVGVGELLISSDLPSLLYRFYLIAITELDCSSILKWFSIIRPVLNLQWSVYLCF